MEAVCVSFCIISGVCPDKGVDVVHRCGIRQQTAQAGPQSGAPVAVGVDAQRVFGFPV